MIALQCRGVTKVGHRCRICWDLNDRQLCQYHQHQVVHDNANDTTNPRVHVGTAASRPLVTREPSMKPCARSGTRDPVLETRYGTKMPPLWSIQYIKSSRVAVIRVKSEWSGRCHHDPVVVKLSRWLRVNKMAVTALSMVAGCIPCVGSSLQSELQCMHGTIDRSEGGVKGHAAVLSKNGRVESGGDVGCAQYFKEQDVLRKLLKHRDPGFSAEVHVPMLFNVVCADDKDNCPIWVTNDEYATHKKDLTRREQSHSASPLTLTVERVGSAWTAKRLVLVHWKLQDPDAASSPVVDSGAVYPGEPCAISHRLSRETMPRLLLVLSIHDKDNQLGEATIPLEEVSIPLSKNVRLNGQWSVDFRIGIATAVSPST